MAGNWLRPHCASPDLWERQAWGLGDPWSRTGPCWWQGENRGWIPGHRTSSPSPEPFCRRHTPRKGSSVLEAQELMSPDTLGTGGRAPCPEPLPQRPGIWLLPSWQVGTGAVQATKRSWALDTLHPAPFWYFPWKAGLSAVPAPDHRCSARKATLEMEGVERG